MFPISMMGKAMGAYAKINEMGLRQAGMYTMGAMGIGAIGGITNPRRKAGYVTGPGTVLGSAMKWGMLGGMAGGFSGAVVGGRNIVKAMGAAGLRGPMARGLMMGRAMRGSIMGAKWGLAGGLMMGMGKALLGSNKS